ncbi:MAG TPA: SAM-dependent methyltransferase [Polyangia bacterium]
MADPGVDGPRRIFFATPGFEEALAAELVEPPLGPRWSEPVGPDQPGLLMYEEPGDGEETGRPLPALDAIIDPIFARQQMPRARAIAGASVAALAEACYAAVEGAIDRAGLQPPGPHDRPERALPPGAFTIFAAVPTGADPRLSSRADLVVEQTLALLRQRRRRAARAFVAPVDAARAFGEVRVVVQLLLLARDHGYVSSAAPRALPRGGWDLAPWPAGAAPVAEDRRPPSRAYRKLEEAFQWMADEPRPGELCVDLGAAPGGWTHGALARGARVIAIDRAPLAPSLRHHPNLQAMAGNAFTYAPPARADWLLSDIVCEPARALELVARWTERDLCRKLVVTVKFKGRESYGMLVEARALLERTGWARARIKHLQHNKNEVTIMAART